MSDYYEPPFTITKNITNLVIEIGELVGRITAHDSLTTNPTIRRENRIKTIYSSLAIEQNTLTIEQVTDVIDGKTVLAPPLDIKEVKNAYNAYEKIQSLDMYSIDDLLQAHKLMTDGLVRESGVFRSGNAGVYTNSHVLIHAGTPANYVPELMQGLFTWLKQSDEHPLIKSCIFHYEFEFIHPFADGNGRMGRLWHTLILKEWKPFFAWIPIETMIHENQDEYYNAINTSNKAGDSTAFIEFILGIIRDTLVDIVTSQKGTQADTESKVLSILKDNPSIKISQVAVQVGVSSRQIERIFASLKKKGILSREGSKKSGNWVIND